MIHITQPEWDWDDFAGRGWVSTADILVTQDAQPFGFDLRPRSDPPNQAAGGGNAVPGGND